MNTREQDAREFDEDEIPPSPGSDGHRMGWPYALTWIAFFAMLAFGFRTCADIQIAESAAKVAK